MNARYCALIGLAGVFAPALGSEPGWAAVPPAAPRSARQTGPPHHKGNPHVPSA